MNEKPLSPYLKESVQPGSHTAAVIPDQINSGQDQQHEDTLGGGDASLAPKSLTECERRASDDCVFAGQSWDDPQSL